jgi:hypothetical protein
MESGAGVMMWRMGYVHNAEMIKIASSTVTEYGLLSIKSQCDVQIQSLTILCHNNHGTKGMDQIVEPHANSQHAQRESLFIINTARKKPLSFLTPRRRVKPVNPYPPFPKSKRTRWMLPFNLPLPARL